jgi:hypothetical protein
MQDAVSRGRLDAVAVDVLGEREHPLAVTLGIFGVDPLIAGVLVLGRAAPDRQHPPFERDVDVVRTDARQFAEHDRGGPLPRPSLPGQTR